MVRKHLVICDNVQDCLCITKNKITCNSIFGCRQVIVREGKKNDFKRLLGKFREIVC